MRCPSTQNNNPAATLVLICETDAHLRREAFSAQQAARQARQALPTLDIALSWYDQAAPTSSTLGDFRHPTFRRQLDGLHGYPEVPRA
jgi:hypothetical protein